MRSFSPRLALRGLRGLYEDPSWRPDLSRAFRCTLAFLGPLLVAPELGYSDAVATIAAIAGESLAIVELRGPYSMRFWISSAMALIYAGVVALGASAADNTFVAVAAMGLVAAFAGSWRHLNSDFGLSLGISTSVLFLVGMAYPPAEQPVLSSALAALTGGAFSIAVRMLLWPIRAQQPLRRLVAESWIAGAGYFEALSESLFRPTPMSADGLARAESSLRITLDKSAALLGVVRDEDARPVLGSLETMNLLAARFVTRVMALGVALEPIKGRPEFKQFEASLTAVLETLERLSLAVARAVVTRAPGHILVCNLRVRRAGHLIDALKARVAAQVDDSVERESILALLRQVRVMLADVRATLQGTVDRADGERGGFFPIELPQVSAPTLRPIVASLNLRGPVDPAIVRYTARIAMLMMFAVALYRGFDVPRGYWVPLTIIVVLQPDYGATRKKVGLRVLGTAGGVTLASLLLLANPPRAALIVIAALAMGAFGLSLRRNYGLAVFFTTLMLGLLLRLDGSPTLNFVVERFGSTVAGAGIALVASQFFWPVWERSRFPSNLARALEATRVYAVEVMGSLGAGRSYGPQVVEAKRAAERADHKLFASLERMLGEPESQRASAEEAAALVNANQRLRRLLTAVAVGLEEGPPEEDPVLEELAAAAGRVLSTIAEAAEHEELDRDALAEKLVGALETLSTLRWPSKPSPRLAAAAPHLRRTNTELIGMCAAVGVVAEVDLPVR